MEQSLKSVSLWEEVKDVMNKRGSFLSGGQQQRLCIARTLALKPEVLLMDEPTSALDPVSTNKIEELLLELKQQFTIIIVTHNMSQAARISDNSMFMYLGELVEHGNTTQMFTKPRHKRTENIYWGYLDKYINLIDLKMDTLNEKKGQPLLWGSKINIWNSCTATFNWFPRLY